MNVQAAEHTFSFDHALRIAVARELRLRAGVDSQAIHSLFASLETPRVRTGHRWSWLRTEDAYRHGAALVLVTQLGAVYLTTAAEAVAWLRSKQTVLVVDISAIIAELEQQTGESYMAQPPDGSTTPAA